MRAKEEIQSRYEAYLEEIARVISTAKPGAGLFGIGVSPKNDPCNDRFFTDIQSCLTGIAERAPSSDETEEALSYIYTAQESRRQDFVFFVLSAVHGMTMPLVQYLTPEAAGRLADAYETGIKRVERMPVQTQLLKELYARAGRQPKRKGLFGRG